MKKFIFNSVKTALVLGAVLVIYEQLGQRLAGDYFNLIWWGIVLFSLAVGAFIIWRFKVGVESGYLLFDDVNE